MKWFVYLVNAVESTIQHNLRYPPVIFYVNVGLNKMATVTFGSNKEDIIKIIYIWQE